MTRISIIGGGVSGACAALHALQSQALSVTLFERERRLFGRGPAYSTECAHHLLNVRAHNMSIWQDDHNDFVAWLERKQYGYGANDFVPRKIFGEYVSEALATAEIRYRDRFHVRHEEVIDLEVGTAGVRTVLRSGKAEMSDLAVLALGNPRPNPLLVTYLDQKARDRIVQDPWSPSSRNLMECRRILLVGSGLTAVDVVVDLVRLGYTGTITMVSRHGLLPNAHAVPGHLTVAAPKIGGTSALSLLKAVRRFAEKSGEPWQYTIDCIRPHIQELWQGLPHAEQGRFLKRLRTFWDVHRHRFAPELGELLKNLRSDGKLRVVAAKIVGIAVDSNGAEVRVKRHSSDSKTFKERFDMVVNCTGAHSPFGRPGFELLDKLIDRGVCRPDKHGLGIDTVGSGSVLGRDGGITEGLYALGPLRKGTLWESTAVREIRAQAALLSKEFAEMASFASPLAASGE